MNLHRSFPVFLVLLLAEVAAAPAQNPFSDWDLFRQIVMIPGISGQEAKVMDFIQAALPKSLKVQRDAKNDLWFTRRRPPAHPICRSRRRARLHRR